MADRTYRVFVDDFEAFKVGDDWAPAINHAITWARTSGDGRFQFPSVVEFGDKTYTIRTPIVVANTGPTEEKKTRGIRLVGQNAAVGFEQARTTILYRSTTGVQPSPADSVLLKIYSQDNVVERLALTVEAQTPLRALVRVTTGNASEGMTENVFRGCLFDGKASTEHGAVIGDNLEYSQAPTFPPQCDYVRFYDCKFVRFSAACVHSPNESKQCVQHLFDACRFDASPYAYDVFASNAVFRDCAFANISDAIMRQAIGIYATEFRGGSSEACRAIVVNRQDTSMTPTGQGIPASVTISNFRFSPDGYFAHDGLPPLYMTPARVVDLVSGGPLILIGLDFSGQRLDDLKIRVRNPALATHPAGPNDPEGDPFPVVAIGCSFPNDDPIDGAHRAQTTMLGCRTVRADGSAVMIGLDDRHVCTPPGGPGQQGLGPGSLRYVRPLFRPRRRGWQAGPGAQTAAARRRDVSRRASSARGPSGQAERVDRHARAPRPARRLV